MPHDRKYRRQRFGFVLSIAVGVAGAALAAAPPTSKTAPPRVGWIVLAAGALFALAAGAARRAGDRPEARSAVAAGLSVLFIAGVAALAVFAGRFLAIQDNQATESVTAVVSGCTANPGGVGESCLYTWQSGGQTYSGMYFSALHDGDSTVIKIDPQDPSIADTSPGAVDGPYSDYIYGAAVFLCLIAAGLWLRAELADPGPPGPWAYEAAHQSGPLAY